MIRYARYECGMVILSYGLIKYFYVYWNHLGCGCGHFVSNFLCAACDKHWEDHETFFETEDVRAQNGLPVGKYLLLLLTSFLSLLLSQEGSCQLLTKVCAQIHHNLFITLLLGSLA